MKLLVAYIRTECAARVIRELYETGVRGVTAYEVRGIRGETSTFLYSKRPFEVVHLPEAIKLEILCSEESLDRIIQLLAGAARTGSPGDGMIAVQDVERVLRIRDLEPIA